MKKFFILFISITMLASCDHHNRPEKKDSKDSLLISDTSGSQKNVLNAEKAFSDDIVSSGLKEAFDKYMSFDGVLLKTNHMPIVSKDSVIDFFDKKKIKDFKISRTPTYTDVSQSGDLAYIYGTYEASGTGPKGNPISTKGSYVSIWKKNNEGNWEMVLDCENEGLVPLKKTK